MKKIFFVTSRLPYPPISGRKNVMYNYCKILNEKLGYEVVLASFLENGDVIDNKPSFISKVYTLNNISTKKKIFNILNYTMLRKKYPMQVSLFWDEKINLYISNIIEDEKPDIVMADMVRTTEYLRNSNILKIADLDDMISIRYQRQLENDINYLNPYGAYLYSLPGYIQKILNINILKKWILKNEIKLLKKYEKDISYLYDKTIFVSEKEAQILNEKLGVNKAISVPLGVDIDYYGEFYKKNEIEEYSIAFLGAMNVAHNESGIINFIQNIMPKILVRIPNAKLYIVGGGVTKRLKMLETKNIIFTNRVKDVRKYVGRCNVFICPLTFGSGIKTKNLEAMAMGVPIVTSVIGAENINASNGEEWLIAKSDDEFAEKVILLMRDSKLYDKLRENAYAFVNNNFTWKVAEKKLKEIF